MEILNRLVGQRIAQIDLDLSRDHAVTITMDSGTTVDFAPVFRFNGHDDVPRISLTMRDRDGRGEVFDL